MSSRGEMVSNGIKLSVEDQKTIQKEGRGEMTVRGPFANFKYTQEDLGLDTDKNKTLASSLQPK